MRSVCVKEAFEPADTHTASRLSPDKTQIVCKRGRCDGVQRAMRLFSVLCLTDRGPNHLQAKGERFDLTTSQCRYRLSVPSIFCASFCSPRRARRKPSRLDASLESTFPTFPGDITCQRRSLPGRYKPETIGQETPNNGSEVHTPQLWRSDSPLLRSCVPQPADGRVSMLFRSFS